MDVNSGRIFPTMAAALAAGSKPDHLITGPEKTLRRVKLRLRMASKCENEDRKKRRRMQKASRRANGRRR